MTLLKSDKIGVRMAKDVIQELQDELIKFRDERDWAQFHNPKDLSVCFVIEAAELLEHFRWKTPEETRDYVREKKKEVGSEVADVAIYLLTLAYELNVDLQEVVRRKIKENRTRYPVKKDKGSATKWKE